MAEEGSKQPKINSRFYAIAHHRCPYCRVGRLYPAKTFSLGNFARMNKECSNCGGDFRIEPGFYFGAAYFGYGFSTGVAGIFIFLYFKFFSEYSELWLVAVVLLAMILMIPLNYRYSRTMFLHFFGGARFDPEKAKTDGRPFVGRDGELHHGVTE